MVCQTVLVAWSCFAVPFRAVQIRLMTPESVAALHPRCIRKRYGTRGPLQPGAAPSRAVPDGAYLNDGGRLVNGVVTGSRHQHTADPSDGLVFGSGRGSRLEL